MSSSRRWLVLVAGAALIGGACAPVRPSAPAAATTAAQVSSDAPIVVPAQLAPTPTISAANPAKNDLVMVRTVQGLAAFDWASNRLLFEAPNAVPTPDWSQLVLSAPDGDQATLNVLDGRTGVQKAAVAIPPGLVAAAISTDGRRVALGPAGDNSSQPVGREQTRIVVADPSGTVAPRTFELQGNYAPDAFAYDDQHLFVLEYQPAEAPTSYRVRMLDLKSGAVTGVGTRSKVPAPEESMQGTRHSSVLSPDHQTLYTLYTNQPEHLHSRDLAAGLTQSSGDYFAFVHVLSLSGGWAYCMDLPQPFGVGPASAHALALSPDGQWLYVSDRSSGKVALANTNDLTVSRVADIGADPHSGNATAATQVGPNGALFVSSSSELLVLEPRSLAVQRRLSMPAPPTGLGVSLDGQRLFVSTADRLLAIDPVTGSELGRIATAGAQRIEHVGKT
jgi:hypothetical protein